MKQGFLRIWYGYFTIPIAKQSETEWRNTITPNDKSTEYLFDRLDTLLVQDAIYSVLLNGLLIHEAHKTHHNLGIKKVPKLTKNVVLLAALYHGTKAINRVIGEKI